MSRIALSMVVKGGGKEDENLKRALTSIRPYVDDVFITLTGDDIGKTEQIARTFNCKISKKQFIYRAEKKVIEWLRNYFGWEPFMKEGDEIFVFDDARNYNFSLIPKEEYPWVLWIDCDDVFMGGDNLRKVAELGDVHAVEAFYFRYLYQVELDEKQNIKHVLIEHLRERLVRNSGVYKWIAPIHETLIEQRPTKKTDNYDCYIVHLATDEDRLASLSRNLKNLEYAIYKSEGKDPRHNYYLAKALYDRNNKDDDKKVEKLILDKYIGGDHPSGWPEERAQAWEYLAEVYKRAGHYNKAIKACLNALAEQPEARSTWLTLASQYMYQKDFERALFWVKVGTSIPEKKTTLIKNPKDIQARTLEIIYNSCVNTGKIDEAWAAAQKLVELFPGDNLMIDTYRFIDSLKRERDLTNAVLSLTNHLKETGERAKIKGLLSALPKGLENNPFMINLYQQNNPPTPWGDDEIVIYCGAGFTNWSPKRLSDPQEAFVGGSEEAVILMSKNLAKLGWKVTVYADPGVDEGEYDNVKWLPYYKFNRLDNFNILIGWRDIRFFDGDFKAKKKYLWAHDIQNPIEYTKERLDRINKVFFLSGWHRDNVPSLPKEKALVTSNGIEI